MTALRVLVLCLVVLSLPALLAAPARACVCSDAAPELLRPLPSAALSTTPVFVVAHARENRIELHDAGGNTVQLDSIRVLGVAEQCSGEVEFFRPHAPLTSDASYELTFQDDTYPPRWQSLAKWKVSAKAKNETQLERPEVSFFRVLPGLYCADAGAADAGGPHVLAEDCQSHVEVQVKRETSTPSDRISWLILRAGDNRRVDQLRARDDGYPTYYAYMAQSDDDACLSYELVDELGVTRASEQRCEPDKCARPVSTSGSAFSSCSGEVPFGASLWDHVPEANCEFPSAFSASGPGGARIRIVSHEPQGCALAPASRARPHVLLTTLLTGLVWRRRRRS